MRRTLVVACIMLSMLASSPFAYGEDQPGRRRIGAVIDDDHADLTGVLSPPRKDRASGVVSGKVRLVRRYVPACQGRLVDLLRNPDATCTQAAGLCASTPGPTDIGYWIYTAPAGPPAPTAADWRSTGQIVCRGAGETAEAVEPAVTVADFRRLPLPAAGLKVQPPTGETLINIPTNLYADSRAAILPTVILGFPIRVRATPLRFRWRYGDGTALSTRMPGGPYPQLDTAHTYLRPGRRTVQLSTTYGGEYSVAGGPWLPIDGVATVPSPPATLTVLSAENHLVAEPVG